MIRIGVTARIGKQSAHINLAVRSFCHTIDYPIQPRNQRVIFTRARVVFSIVSIRVSFDDKLCREVGVKVKLLALVVRALNRRSEL